MQEKKEWKRPTFKSSISKWHTYIAIIPALLLSVFSSFMVSFWIEGPYINSTNVFGYIIVFFPVSWAVVWLILVLVTWILYWAGYLSQKIFPQNLQ